MADEAGPRWPRARATGSDVARPAAATRGLGATAVTLASRGTGAGPGGVLRLATQAVTVALCSGAVAAAAIRAPWRASPSWVALAPSPRPQWARGRPGSGCPGVCVDVCVSVCVPGTSGPVP